MIIPSLLTIMHSILLIKFCYVKPLKFVDYYQILDYNLLIKRYLWIYMLKVSYPF